VDPEGRACEYGAETPVASVLVLLQKGRAFRRHGHFEKAREAYEKIRTCENQTERDKRILVEALRGLGVVFFYQGKYRDSIRLFKRSRMVSEEVGLDYWLPHMMVYIGISQQKLGEYEPALENFIKARELALERGDRVVAAHALGERGLLLMELERYDEAIEAMKTAVEEFRQVGTALDIASLKMNLGICLQCAERHDIALGYLQAAGEPRRSACAGKQAFRVDFPRRAGGGVHEPRPVRESIRMSGKRKKAEAGDRKPTWRTHHPWTNCTPVPPDRIQQEGTYALRAA
jgi:tetratricopeptide (TPR) repeat protein